MKFKSSVFIGTDIIGVQASYFRNLRVRLCRSSKKLILKINIFLSNRLVRIHNGSFETGFRSTILLYTAE
jgi:hypothetical protein